MKFFSLAQKMTNYTSTTIVTRTIGRRAQMIKTGPQIRTTSAKQSKNNLKIQRELSNPKYLKPFNYGWKRELVERSTCVNGRIACDVYYYGPNGQKYRSTRDIATNLKGPVLSSENFTFVKKLLGLNDTEKEVYRKARATMGKTTKTVPRPKVVKVRMAPRAKPKKVENQTKVASAKENTPRVQKEKTNLPGLNDIPSNKTPAFLAPFEYGWKREVVVRSTYTNSSPNLDIYYYTTNGSRCRSSREVATHIKNQDLSLENFTFSRVALGVNDPNKETIRYAKSPLNNRLKKIANKENKERKPAVALDLIPKLAQHKSLASKRRDSKPQIERANIDNTFGRGKRARVPNKLFTENNSETNKAEPKTVKIKRVIDLSDPKYLKPFRYGWRREVVFRRVVNQKCHVADIYYHNSDGVKVRSMPDLLPYLRNGTLLTENFTFYPKPLGVNNPRLEYIRQAVGNRKRQR